MSQMNKNNDGVTHSNRNLFLIDEVNVVAAMSYLSFRLFRMSSMRYGSANKI